MRKRKQATPIPAMMMPGTMKDKPQLEETQYPAIREPRMFPTDVCEFHRPMMRPRLTGSDVTALRRPATVSMMLASAELHHAKLRPYRPFPNQLPMQVTTLGQPVVWTKPFTTWEEKAGQK